jgi:hypothetical protein
LSIHLAQRKLINFTIKKAETIYRLGLENAYGLHNVHSGGATVLGRAKIEPKRMAAEYRRSNQEINIMGKEYPKRGSGANAHFIDSRYTLAHE